jgi:hypothetical protein
MKNNSLESASGYSVLSTIYKKLLKVIPGLDKKLSSLKDGTEEFSAKSKVGNGGLMDLNFEYRQNEGNNRHIISLAHYYVQEGDLMSDPFMEIRVIPDLQLAEALYFEMSYPPVSRYVYPDPQHVSMTQKKEQNHFLNQWLTNLIHQGHKIDLNKKVNEEIGALPIGLKGKIYGLPYKVLIQYNIHNKVSAEIYEDTPKGELIVSISGEKKHLPAEIQKLKHAVIALQYKQVAGTPVAQDKMDKERDKTIEKFIKNISQEVSDYNLGKTKLPKKHSVSPGAKKALEELRKKQKQKPEKKKSISKSKTSKHIVPIERIDEEHRIIRRFVALHGKTKTHEQVMSFLDYVQKAMLDRRIKKNSLFAAEIMHIQNELVKIYNQMIDKKLHHLELSLSPKELNEYGAIAKSQYEMPSIQLLKRYVSWDGKRITKEKAIMLRDQMSNAVKKGKLTNQDPYATQASKAYENLVKYVALYKRNTPLKIYEAELKGVLEILTKAGNSAKNISKKLSPHIKNILRAKNKVAKVMREFYADKLHDSHGNLITDVEQAKAIAMSEGRNIDGLLGDGIIVAIAAGIAAGASNALVRQQLNKKGVNGVVSSESVKDTKVQTIGITGKWKTLFGDPSHGFTVLIYGEPKGGKSTMSLNFAKHLAENHGNSLYVTAEEGVTSPSFIKKIKDHNIEHPRLFMSDTLPTNLTPYEFIFIDSINKIGLGEQEISALKKQYPKKNFIFIAQSTKNGNYKGSEGIKHEVDTVVEVESGIAKGYGRFNPEGEITIFQKAD